jgi:NAD(P)-dependent dehydrogenase (short-subunit alcohol dehydrogenase family)
MPAPASRFSLQDKRALVSGALHGIGAEIAGRLFADAAPTSPSWAGTREQRGFGPAVESFARLRSLMPSFLFLEGDQ